MLTSGQTTLTTGRIVHVLVTPAASISPFWSRGLAVMRRPLWVSL